MKDQNMDNLKEVLEALKERTTDPSTPLHANPDSVELRICSIYPEVKWQCNVKFRDARTAWATSVEEDPEVALVKAIGIALRGSAGQEGQALFHLQRTAAKEVEEDLKDIFGSRLAWTKVEFEPYRGWVVVVSPQDPEDADALAKTLSGQAEVRTDKHRVSPSRTSDGATAARRAAGQEVPTRSPITGEGRLGLPKKDLEEEYKRKHGKYPDRNIKKADLAKMLDEMEARGEL